MILHGDGRVIISDYRRAMISDYRRAMISDYRRVVIGDDRRVNDAAADTARAARRAGGARRHYG